jgi:hypothetical protein
MMAAVTTHAMLDVVQAYSSRLIARHEMTEIYGGFERFVSARLPAECDGLVLQLVAMYAADNLKKLTFTRPFDWWEAVKERFAPQWFLTRYPVRYHTDIVDMKAIWAGYRPATDKYGPFLPYVLQRSFDDSEMD